MIRPCRDGLAVLHKSDMTAIESAESLVYQVRIRFVGDAAAIIEADRKAVALAVLDWLNDDDCPWDADAAGYDWPEIRRRIESGEWP